MELSSRAKIGDLKKAKRHRTCELENENHNLSKLKMIMMVIEILTWLRSSMPAIPLLKKKTKARQYVFHKYERQAEVNEPNKMKMISLMIGFWILTWVVINAYHAFEN